MTDPTRIDIDLDPKRRVIDGIARHGNTPFCCPLISHIEGNLWQGGCVNGLPLPPEIVHVVSLYPWESYKLHDGIKTQLAVMAYDSEPSHIAPLLDSVSDWVLSCVGNGPTLVHCQAGLNRSSLVAALVLMKGGMDASTAIDHLRATRSPAVLCNKSFEAWLKEWRP